MKYACVCGNVDSITGTLQEIGVNAVNPVAKDSALDLSSARSSCNFRERSPLFLTKSVQE